MKRYFKFGAALTLTTALTLFASGCSQKTAKVETTEDTAVVETMVEKDEMKKAPATNESSTMGATGSEESLDTPMSESKMNFTILEGRSTGPMLPIYFDFDKSNIRNDQKSRIERNANYIKDNKGAKVVIEGNCDEKGTNEYNMALGERRALSAKKYLTNLGVSSNSVHTISFGEEKPLNHGHDELAWSQNRRADFVQVQ